MSVLYCTIPYFVTALAQRDAPDLAEGPLVLIDSDGRVFGVSAEAAVCGIVVGMAPKTVEMRCPEASLVQADVVHCQDELEIYLQVLECSSSQVEPHGWGAAYIDLGDSTQQRRDAIAYCQQIGRAVRQELGPALQPALGWDSTKFTAQAAARRVHPGHLLAVDHSEERTFLQPLPATLLPLSIDALRRLGFLGLRTCGQYAGLPSAAVGLQFGRAGQLAHRCARGEDDRPIIPRYQRPHQEVQCELDVPLRERERILMMLQQIVAPALAEMRENLKACTEIRLRVDFDDKDVQERTRTFLFPTANEAKVVRALNQLLDKMHWRAGVVSLAVVLERIQDVVGEQLTLFPLENERERKLLEVQRYLAARFGDNRLRRVVLSHPSAPLPEWRVDWVEDDA